MCDVTAVLSTVPGIFETAERISKYCERYRASETPGAGTM